MAQCTAPRNGHRTASAREKCPVCRTGGGYRSYGSYPSYSSPYVPVNSVPTPSSPSSSGGGRSKAKASWAPSGSSVLYSPAEIRTLTPVRENVEKRLGLPDLRDVFLCHAWDDRKGAAKELNDSLVSKGVAVWFSENDVPLGSSLLRDIVV